MMIGIFVFNVIVSDQRVPEGAMAKLVRVFVVDGNGKGLHGQRVNAYNQTGFRTDNNGVAEILLDGVGSSSIYVNGFKVWQGYKSAAPPTVTYTKR